MILLYRLRQAGAERKNELLKQDNIKVNRTGVFVTLDKTQKAKMVYRNPANGEEFALYYNTLPSGEKTPTVSQKPDNVLTLKKNDSASEYKYIFNAKYRLNPAYEDTSYRRDYGTPGPFLPNASKLMEAFLDEIIQDSPEKAYERSTVPQGTKDYY